MTFDELFAEHKLTALEREQLVSYLAGLRAAQTIKALGVAPVRIGGLCPACGKNNLQHSGGQCPTPEHLKGVS